MKYILLLTGPRPSTVVDFWRMVWQENARVIVCLTNIREADTVSFLAVPGNENNTLYYVDFIAVLAWNCNFFQKKCAKYWPDLNDKHMEGCIGIRCQKEQTYAENVVRHLRINNTSVRHYYHSLINLHKLIFVKSYKDYLTSSIQHWSFEEFVEIRDKYWGKYWLNSYYHWHTSFDILDLVDKIAGFLCMKIQVFQQNIGGSITL